MQHVNLLSAVDVSSVTTLREVFDLFAGVDASDIKYIVQLLQAIAMLFERVTSAVDYRLLVPAFSPSLAVLLRVYSAQSDSTVPLFSAVEELLTQFFDAAKRTHRSMYDSKLLASLSGVLAATLMHCKKSVKHKSVMFWGETFGAQTKALDYPPMLHGVLAQLKHVVSQH